MEQGYRSVRKRSAVEIERKRSRFIGIAAPVPDAIGAETEIARAREEYPGASHYCYAYRAGLDALVVRMSDAGEPQGTAGRPMLEVLERNELVNVCVVVVRYFGGTLLGAAGLVRAYSAAASEAVAEAGIVSFAAHVLLRVHFDYADWSRAERALRSSGTLVTGVEYGENVAVEVAAPKERTADFEDLVTQLTAGRSAVHRIGERFLPTAPES